MATEVKNRKGVIIRGFFTNGHPFYTEIKEAAKDQYLASERYMQSTSDGAFINKSTIAVTPFDVTETTRTGRDAEEV
jgi:hypothetical protein